MHCTISQLPLDIVMLDVIQGLRNWLSARGWVSHPNIGISLYMSAPTGTATQSGFSMSGASWWTSVFAGYSFLILCFTYETDSMPYETVIFGQLNALIQQCVNTNMYQETGANKPYAYSRGLYQMFPPDTAMLMMSKYSHIDQSTPSMGVNGYLVHCTGSLANSNGFGATIPLTDDGLLSWVSNFAGLPYGFKGIDLQRKGFLIRRSYFEEMGISGLGLYKQALYGQPTPESGTRFFVVAASFPLYIFMFNFVEYAADMFKLQKDILSWFRFLDTNSRKPAPCANGGASYNVLSTNVLHAHFAFCCIGSSQQWDQIIDHYYSIWPLRSFYDPNSIGLKTYLSTSSSSFVISGLINAQNRPFSVPEVTVPSQLSDDFCWNFVPGQENNAVPSPVYPWNLTKGNETIVSYGTQLFDRLLPAPTIPAPVPPIPAAPDPTPDPQPDPNGVDLSQFQPKWVGTNADFWNAILNPSESIGSIFSKYPLLTEANLEKVLQLRDFSVRYSSFAALKSVMTAALNDESWTLKQILTSNAVLPYNIGLIENIVRWFAAIRPSQVTSLNLPSIDGTGDFAGLISALLDKHTSVTELVARYPLEALNYGTQLLYLAKYLRTGTYP